MKRLSVLLMVVALSMPAAGSINDDGTPGGNRCQPVVCGMFLGVFDYTDGSTVVISGVDMKDPCTGEIWMQVTGYQVLCGNLDPCMAAGFVPTW